MVAPIHLMVFASCYDLILGARVAETKVADLIIEEVENEDGKEERRGDAVGNDVNLSRVYAKAPVDIYAWTRYNGWIKGIYRAEDYHQVPPRDGHGRKFRIYDTVGFYDVNYASKPPRFRRATMVDHYGERVHYYFNREEMRWFYHDWKTKQSTWDRPKSSYVLSTEEKLADAAQSGDLQAGVLERFNNAIDHKKEPSQTGIVGARDSKCVQWLPHARITPDGTGDGSVGSEDCLRLDIAVPIGSKYGVVFKGTPGGSKEFNVLASAQSLPSGLPVIVFIHGGAFLLGDKFQSGLYDGRALAQQTGSVVVSINYRLSALGFLAHPASNADDKNLGLWDQTLALTWVQMNIDRFGGDPEKVTIMGQSAGGVSVCSHLASRTSEDLFKAAIILSGNCDSNFFYAPVQRAEWHSVQYIRRIFERFREFSDIPWDSDASKVSTFMAQFGPSCARLYESAQRLCGAGCDSNMKGLASVLSFEETQVNRFGYDTVEINYFRITDEAKVAEADKRLLECAAEEKMAKYAWINSMGVPKKLYMVDQAERSLAFGGFQVERVSAWLHSKKAVTEESGGIFGIHLPWTPVVNAPFYEGATVNALPRNVISRWHSDPTRIKPIWANWMKNDGTIFVPMLSWFGKGEHMNKAMIAPTFEHMRLIIRDLLCVDVDKDSRRCEERTSTTLHRYKVETGAESTFFAKIADMIRDKMFVCSEWRILRPANGTTRSKAKENFHWFSTYEYASAFTAIDKSSFIIARLNPLLRDALSGPEKETVEQHLGAFHMAELATIFSWGGGTVGSVMKVDWEKLKLAWLERAVLGLHFPPHMRDISDVMADSIKLLRLSSDMPWRSAGDDDSIGIFGDPPLTTASFSHASGFDNHCDFWDEIQAEEDAKWFGR